MEDKEILALYFSRDKQAITQTDRKYGALCRGIARGILTVPEDAEECVSDAYLNAWNAIPPQCPEKLGVWLGRVVQNLAYYLWNHAHRKKRDTGMTELLGELADYIPSSADPMRQLELDGGCYKGVPHETGITLHRYAPAPHRGAISCGTETGPRRCSFAISWFRLPTRFCSSSSTGTAV